MAITQSIKQEQVGYLKSALHLRQATLVLTDNRISLEADDTGVMGRGILTFLPFMKDKLGKSKMIFDLALGEIGKVTQGKHSVQKNVLEITDRHDNTYRMIVGSYQEWEGLLRQKIIS